MKYCYCSVGAGGKPCVDRLYCDTSEFPIICAIDGCQHRGEYAFSEEFCISHVCKRHKELIEGVTT